MKPQVIQIQSLSFLMTTGATLTLRKSYITIPTRIKKDISGPGNQDTGHYMPRLEIYFLTPEWLSLARHI